MQRLLSCLPLAVPCLAQSNLVVLSSIVTDPQGDVAPQASVIASSGRTGVKPRSATPQDFTAYKIGRSASTILPLRKHEAGVGYRILLYHFNKKR